MSMLTIRLSRTGRKNQPLYRVIISEKGRDPWGNALEILGHYNPRRHPRELVLDVERVKYWLSKGADASETVWNLLIDEKLVEGKKRNVTHLNQKRQKSIADEKAKNEEAKAAPAEAPKAEEPKAEEPAA